jgi:hypothetical protein
VCLAKDALTMGYVWIVKVFLGALLAMMMDVFNVSMANIYFKSLDKDQNVYLAQMNFLGASAVNSTMKLIDQSALIVNIHKFLKYQNTVNVSQTVEKI